MVQLPSYLFDDFVHRAKRDAPNESCGIFGGRGENITCLYSMTNIDQSPEHFSLSPQQQFYVVKDMRRRGLELIGVVHSHPATPARLSDEDKRLALDPSILYFIVSLASDQPVIKAFQKNDKQYFDEVPIRVIEEAPANLFRLPDSVIEDVRGYREQLEKRQPQHRADIRFKAYRVPMGLYEQRKNGTFMARVRTPAGVVSSLQLRALAEASRRFGDEHLHLTTRQDVQIHNVPLDRSADLMEYLLSFGLVCRGGGGNTVRNITADPLAGILDDEPFDVTPYAMAASEYLIKSRSSFNLPRKFKIAFSSNHLDRGLTVVADLGFIAKLEDGQEGFMVYAGGGMGSSSRVSIPVKDFLPANELCFMLEAVKRLFDRYGDRQNKSRARLRFVLERFGQEKFRELIANEFLEVKKSAIEITRPRREQFLRDLTGEPSEKIDDFLIEQKIKGLYAIRLHPPLGDIDGSTFEWLADLVDRFLLETRLTHEQGLVLRNIRGQEVPALIKELNSFDPALIEVAPSLHPVVCKGAATCKLGLCLSQNLATEITNRLKTLPPGLINSLPRIYISGCPNSCGQHPVGELAFSGHARRLEGHLAPYYKVWLGSQRGATKSLARVMATIPAKRIPAFVQDLAETAVKASGDEKSFIERVGHDHFESFNVLVQKYEPIRSYEQDPDFYKDFGQERDFSLAGRGPGECGVGVMDVIRMDLEEAESQHTAYRLSGKDEQLYAAALSAMRSLLILRGVDTQKERQIIQAFQEHFVRKGWVRVETDNLVDGLLDFKLGDINSLAQYAGQVGSLIKRVRELFLSLNSQLEFTIDPESKPSNGSDKKGSHLLDLRGVVCPINYVKVKLQMEQISVGETLEVILDKGEPIQNVPRSLENDGHDVLEIQPFEQGLYKLTVQKKQ